MSCMSSERIRMMTGLVKECQPDEELSATHMVAPMAIWATTTMLRMAMMAGFSASAVVSHVSCM